MDVHASPEALRELKEYLDPFEVCFRRKEGKQALERYTTGLVTELPHKNCDTIAQAVPGTSDQRLQEFLTNMVWDEEELNRQRVHKMVTEATLGDGVIIFDDTGFVKQGHSSVGVARQYTGTMGKVCNCQVAVTCSGVPEGVGFLTKPQIALSLLDQARNWGVPHSCVVADAGYGDNPHFLEGLESRDEHYVVGVRVDFGVRLTDEAPAC
jgi:SRSO17 transposase